MTGTVSLTQFWRVGRSADSPHVDVRYQGAGRFDDPERLIAVYTARPRSARAYLSFYYRGRDRRTLG